jgi:hypothetical protein
MSTAIKIVIGLGLTFVLVGLFACGSLMSFNNTSVDLETQISAQYEANQAVYDKTWKSIVQTANVADAHAEKFKDIVVKSVEGRYGNDSGLLFKAISESSGQALPVELFAKVQQIIEAGQAEFTANQKILISKKQTYERHLKTFPNTVYAGMLGYPRIKLDEFKIVTSDKTDAAFSAGKDEPVMPFKVSK